jgi:hypothetical protein
VDDLTPKKKREILNALENAENASAHANVKHDPKPVKRIEKQSASIQSHKGGASFKSESQNQTREPLSDKTCSIKKQDSIEPTTKVAVPTSTPKTDAAIAIDAKEKKEKDLRKLRKTLRQIEQLESTSTLYFDEGQMKKMQKKPAILAEIQRLENELLR